MANEHTYEVALRWTGATETGTARYREYDRTHEVSVDGKTPIIGSADPAFRGEPDLWNPEEMLVAALAQCHMLSYLAACALNKVVVTAYSDQAHGRMAESAGNGQFTEVVLRPRVVVAEASMVDQATALHERAHDACFIANSVNFPVRHEARIEVAAG